MRISDWSSDVCSSDLRRCRKASRRARPPVARPSPPRREASGRAAPTARPGPAREAPCSFLRLYLDRATQIGRAHVELPSLMRISYAVFCLKKKTLQPILAAHATDDPTPVHTKLHPKSY